MGEALVHTTEYEAGTASRVRAVTAADIGRMPTSDQSHLRSLVKDGVIQTNLDLIDYGVSIAHGRPVKTVAITGSVVTRLASVPTDPEKPKDHILLIDDVVAQKPTARRILTDETVPNPEVNAVRNRLLAAIMDGLGHFAKLYVTVPK